MNPESNSKSIHLSTSKLDNIDKDNSYNDEHPSLSCIDNNKQNNSIKGTSNNFNHNNNNTPTKCIISSQRFKGTRRDITSPLNRNSLNDKITNYSLNSKLNRRALSQSPPRYNTNNNKNNFNNVKESHTRSRSQYDSYRVSNNKANSANANPTNDLNDNNELRNIRSSSMDSDLNFSRYSYTETIMDTLSVTDNYYSEFSTDYDDSMYGYDSDLYSYTSSINIKNPIPNKAYSDYDSSYRYASSDMKRSLLQSSNQTSLNLETKKPNNTNKVNRGRDIPNQQRYSRSLSENNKNKNKNNNINQTNNNNNNNNRKNDSNKSIKQSERSGSITSNTSNYTSTTNPNQNKKTINNKKQNTNIKKQLKPQNINSTDTNNTNSRRRSPSHSYKIPINLSKSIHKFYSDNIEPKIKISSDFQNVVSEIVNKLQLTLNASYGENVLRVRVFGSSKTGLGLSASDIDISLETDVKYRDPPFCSSPKNLFCANEPESINDYNKLTDMSRLANVLTDAGYLEVEPISTAKYPICKCRDDIHGISCDITFNNCLASYNTELLRLYTLLDPRVGPLILLVKYWAKVNNLNDTRGVPSTLSSYGWSLLVISFLQCKGILCNLQDPLLCSAVSDLAHYDYIRKLEKEGGYYYPIMNPAGSYMATSSHLSNNGLNFDVESDSSSDSDSNESDGELTEISSSEESSYINDKKKGETLKTENIQNEYVIKHENFISNATVIDDIKISNNNESPVNNIEEINNNNHTSNQAENKDNNFESTKIENVNNNQEEQLNDQPLESFLDLLAKERTNYTFNPTTTCIPNTDNIFGPHVAPFNEFERTKFVVCETQLYCTKQNIRRLTGSFAERVFKKGYKKSEISDINVMFIGDRGLQLLHKYKCLPLDVNESKLKDGGFYFGTLPVHKTIDLRINTKPTDESIADSLDTNAYVMEAVWEILNSEKYVSNDSLDNRNAASAAENESNIAKLEIASTNTSTNITNNTDTDTDIDINTDTNNTDTKNIDINNNSESIKDGNVIPIYSKLTASVYGSGNYYFSSRFKEISIWERNPMNGANILFRGGETVPDLFFQFLQFLFMMTSEKVPYNSYNSAHRGEIPPVLSSIRLGKTGRYSTVNLKKEITGGKTSFAIEDPFLLDRNVAYQCKTFRKGQISGSYIIKLTAKRCHSLFKSCSSDENLLDGLFPQSVDSFSSEN